MGVKITFLGHAAFLLDDGNTKLLTDPMLTGNDKCPVSAEEVEADYLLVTHGHSDHTGDSLAISKRTKAPVVCTVDLAEGYYTPEGVETIQGNMGGTIKLPFGAVKFINAIHGSGIPGCLSCGFLITIGGKKIYFAGDTALMSDMAFLADEEIDLALLPIGDTFTMGPKDALKAVKLIQPKLVVPMHYNTFPPIVQDADAFAASVEQAGFACKVLGLGDSLEI